MGEQQRTRIGWSDWENWENLTCFSISEVMLEFFKRVLAVYSITRITAIAAFLLYAYPTGIQNARSLITQNTYLYRRLCHGDRFDVLTALCRHCHWLF